MRVGGQDAVALVERHVQRVLRSRARRRRARATSSGIDGRAGRREQPAAVRDAIADHERDRRRDDRARDEQRPLAGERSRRRDTRARRPRPAAAPATCRRGAAELGEQPDRDHEPGERPVADVAHLRPLVEDPRAQQVHRPEADRQRDEREPGDERRRARRAGRRARSEGPGSSRASCRHPGGPHEGDVPPATSRRGLPSPPQPPAISPTWTV